MHLPIVVFIILFFFFYDYDDVRWFTSIALCKHALLSRRLEMCHCATQHCLVESLEEEEEEKNQNTINTLQKVSVLSLSFSCHTVDAKDLLGIQDQIFHRTRMPSRAYNSIFFHLISLLFRRIFTSLSKAFSIPLSVNAHTMRSKQYCISIKMHSHDTFRDLFCFFFSSTFMFNNSIYSITKALFIYIAGPFRSFIFELNAANPVRAMLAEFKNNDLFKTILFVVSKNETKNNRHRCCPG